MPESPEQLYERVAGTLIMPPVDEWETFPFDGEMRPRALLPPAAVDTPRSGADGVDCRLCLATDGDYLWTNERWRLRGLARPSGLPVVVLLEPRQHVAEPGDLSDELASELGRLLARIERAVRAVGEIGRVHVCRWGDGSEHLHWWFLARPARFPQLVGSLAAIWDDVLPPLPEDVWRANLDRVARELDAGGG
jgi:diadenosine tetraphosphate (Ap4A) HIT family hydrolase